MPEGAGPEPGAGDSEIDSEVDRLTELLRAYRERFGTCCQLDCTPCRFPEDRRQRGGLRPPPGPDQVADVATGHDTDPVDAAPEAQTEG